MRIAKVNTMAANMIADNIKPQAARMKQPMLLRTLSLMLLAMVAMLGVSCDDPVDYSTTVPPESQLRIISLSPALTQILIDLGQSESIVGVGQNDAAAPKHAKVVGTYLNINAEQIVSLNPTLVVTMSGRDGPPARLKELAETHFMLVDYPYPKTPTDVGNIIFRDSELHSALGGMLAQTGQGMIPPTAGSEPAAGQDQQGKDAQGEQVVQKEAEPASLGALLDLLPQAMRLKYTMIMRMGELSKLTTKDGDGQNNPSVLLVIGNGPVMASGPGTVLDQMLILAGGRNAAAGTNTTAPTFDREKLLTLAPDVVLYFDPKGQPLGALASEPRLADFRDLDIPAVKNKRIVIIDHPLAMLPTSTLDQTAGMMAKAIHPELSEQIDVILKSSMIELERKNEIHAAPDEDASAPNIKPGSVSNEAAAPATPVTPVTPASAPNDSVDAQAGDGN